ncbi:MAG: hypothetical protein ABGX04_14145 [Myxococcales bacterium]|nr:hypothetical protein [Myxococcales bacterium]HIK84938.1 hypothetical protein [Myxococcales bacterium]
MMRKMHRIQRAVTLLLGVTVGVLLAGAVAAVETIRQETTLGPVQLKVAVSPGEPVIGDIIKLELSVLAAAGVEILMPEFGEALGRFEIVDFAPSEDRTPAGETLARQVYRLQPVHSGIQSIPPLRVEFVDRRLGQKQAPEGLDAYEIMTDRIALEVAPILAKDAPLELRPRHPDLGRRTTTSERSIWIALAVLVVVALALGPFAWRFLNAALERRRRQSAFEVARAELDSLLGGGRPTAETMDAFYVKLSLIVRTYLEDRFGLRSPELTTQEFLTEMGRSPDLARSHQNLLQNFLEEADLVKFAGHKPDAEVVGTSIAAAEQFLTETRDFVRVSDVDSEPARV